MKKSIHIVMQIIIKGEGKTHLLTKQEQQKGKGYESSRYVYVMCNCCYAN